jgi:hypothetical protein
MRKIFFILLASTIVLALSNCGKGGSSDNVFNPNDTIPGATALAMYNHYSDSNVNKGDSAIIRQIFPSVASMKQVLKTHNLTGIKFLVAAYLNTDPIVARRNEPMILLQLKTEKGGNPVYYYYDLNTVSSFAAPQKPYCPPPPCLAVEQ